MTPNPDALGRARSGVRGRRGRTSARSVATATAVLFLAVLGVSCSGTDSASSPGTTETTVAPTTTTLPETPIEEGSTIYTYVPEVGDCYDKRKLPGANGAKPQDIVLKLDCTQGHVNEVFAIVEAPKPDDPKDTTYPGDEALRKFGKVECPKHYEAYVGKPYELSKLEIGYILPGEATWPSNRKLACIVFDGTGRRVNTSVKGTGA